MHVLHALLAPLHTASIMMFESNSKHDDDQSVMCCISKLAAIISRVSIPSGIQCFCILVSLPVLFVILTQLSSPAALRAMQTKCLALHPVLSTNDADIWCAKALLHCVNDSVTVCSHCSSAELQD